MRLVAVLLAALLTAVAAAPADGARRCKHRRCVVVGHAKAKRAGANWKRMPAPVFTPAAGGQTAPSGSGTTPAPGSDAPPPPPPPPPPAADPHRLQVRADEFSLVRSQARVATGDVTVEFTTVDAEDPHDLAIFRTDGAGDTYRFDELGPGKSVAAVVEFKAGEYKLICTLPEHESRGMSATVVAE
jgi:plastocyanin